MTDPSVKDVPSDGELAATPVAEATSAVVVRKSKLSEDEIRLGEEAFLNALIELEALGNTAAEVETERVEKEREVRSEIEDLRRTQEEQIEEAHNLRRATQEQSAEEQTQDPGTEPPQRAEGEYESSEEGGHLHVDDSSETTLPAESLISETDFSIVPSESLMTGSALQDYDTAAVRNIAEGFDEEAEDVRNAAALALFDLQPDRPATFARALREGSPERRRRIGAAFATSGLADIAIGNLAGPTREQGYEAFSLLFLMTKTGEVEPLLRAVEQHPSIEVRLTVVKLLALNAQAEIVPSLRRLAVSGVLPSEVRAAVIEAIYELGRQLPRQLSSRREGIDNQINL